MKKMILITVMALFMVSPVFSDEYEDARILLLKEEGGNIIFLSKINLGIPGVVSWIANRDMYTGVYTIDDLNNVTYLGGGGIAEKSKMQTYDDIDLEFDVFQDITGTPLGSKAAIFGDYNGDGRDEILFFEPLITNKLCGIMGYNTETNKMAILFAYSYTILDKEGPPPVEFVNYQGTDGILVYYRNHGAERYVYGFFVWDEVTHEYKKDMELLADEVARSMFTTWNGGGNKNVNKFTEEEKNPQSDIDTENQTEAVVETNAKEGSIPLWTWVAIIGGVVVIASGVVIFTIKRKKK